MPRIRSVKPDFWTSVDIAALSIGTRLTFIGMWNMAEDNGVGVANERLLAASLYPMDDHDEALTRVRRALDELSRGGQIVVYEVDGKRLYAIVAWHHQRIDRPAKHDKHARPEDCAHTVVACGNDGSSQAQLMLVEPSSSPRSARASGKDQGAGSREGCGEGREQDGSADAEPPKPKRRKPELPLPESWRPVERHREYAHKHNLDIDREVTQFRHYAAANDRRQRDWDSAFSTWLDKAVQFGRGKRAAGDSHCEAWR